MRIIRPFALAVLVGLLPGVSAAGDYKLGALEIGHPWSRATPPSAPTAGGFLVISNTGTTPDRLVAARTAASDQVQIHQMKMEGDVMRMRELDHGLDVPAGATVTLAPGGYHLMLIGLKAPLKAGAHVPVTLVFEKAGSVDVELDVQAMGSTGPAHGR